jgi:cobalt-zinc-cadmium efflux system outer membrane protein
MGSRAGATVLAVLGLSSALAAAEPLTSDQAVGMALSRNRDVIAARFDIEAADLDRVAARVYPNPVLAYSIGNLVLGSANPQGETPPVSSGFVGQTVHLVSVATIIDVWDKRHARMRTADRGLDLRRLLVEDALREIVYAVRSAFNDVVGETADVALVRDNRARYADTIRISRARRDAGDISEAELRKIELEGLRYENAVIDQEMQLDLARQRLAALLALGPEAAFEPIIEEPGPRAAVALEPMVEQALRDRPDYRAVRAARRRGEAAKTQAGREALPDISLGVGFTHSEFLVSGDNPNALGLSLSLPLPLFDRNQANIGRAGLDIRRADNDAERLAIQIRHEVADGARRVKRASALLDVYEGGGGMLQRAETALQVAERSYKAGALSLLELLEAQRTFIEARERYLRARHDHRQATIDLVHSVAGDIR